MEKCVRQATQNNMSNAHCMLSN